jgi:RNA polymerase sigma-70 factor (ECF subfamily)
MKTALSTSPGSISSDLALVRQTLQGDDKAFELIMRRNNRTLYRAARAILLDDADAEDAVQEAYLRAYRALGGFEGEARLTTWLTRIVINEALERLRKRKREAGTVSLENVVDLEMHMNDTSNGNAGGRRPEGPESAAMRAQTRRLLEQKIDQLPSAFRTVFILRALEEMSVEETAACLDLNGATVRTGDRCDRIVNTVLERVRLLRETR